MISNIDIYILPVIILYGCCIFCNVHSSSSGIYRPDFFLAPSGPPLFVGEDKLLSNYSKGKKGHDPFLENEYKTPWDMWEEFWGDIPYIFAYAALGETSHLEFILGVLERDILGVLELERDKKKFVPLLGMKTLPIKRCPWPDSILQSCSSRNIGDRHDRTESYRPVSQLTLQTW